ncbi:hypothetical protein EXIGLDRAFT_762773 [Exidia glandulosa HHB12029]|uniref:Histone deacetylase interacting domain-containing protein n=1 Tax=Exidia glandulosa HHB12029 TaxID=1314781 RepID=A0A165MGS1_EXIGL|nr:hypothetical protein EXIGLDRAFT_762773 [Exidia glandulosa HHB12029]
MENGAAAPAAPDTAPKDAVTKSPSLEDGEVPEDDVPASTAEQPTSPSAQPPPPPQPSARFSGQRSPPLRPHAYGPGAQKTAAPAPLPPQDRLWERERDTIRDRERERDRDRDREKELERLDRERADRERAERERDLRERELRERTEREQRERDQQLEREQMERRALEQMERRELEQHERQLREQAEREEDAREQEAAAARERQLLLDRDPPPALIEEPAEPPVEERQLDVTDALSYLDMVKAQFHDSPDIYNKFLDTMKQFKSEQINTPGVIDRVSELFAGHPQLIQGFNAFLPQGYRIECTTSFITVTTPSGTRTQAPPRPVQAIPIAVAGAPSTPRSMHQERENREKEMRERVAQREQREARERERDRKMREQREWEAQQQQLAAMVPPPVPQQDPPFNAAMDYVNRIKHRFHDEPEIYRQFLDVLQTYQRGGQTDSAVVFQQVTVLFRGNQDLIEEFKKFVNYGGDDVGMMMGGPSQDMEFERERPDRERGRKRVTNDTVKRKRRPIDRNDENSRGAPARPPKKQRTEKLEQQMAPPGQWMREPSPPPVSNVRGGHTHAHGHQHQLQQQQQQPPPQQGHQHHQHQPQPLAPPPLPDESTFFARVGDPDFARLARDFANGESGVDLRMLVDYLGDTPVGVEFREIVGWPSFLKPSDAANGVPTPGTGEGVWTLASKVDEDEDIGPSYRRLPKSEIGRHISGRDEMCREVLNDEFVSHPSWAPGYDLPASQAAQRHTTEKNSYERALYRSEDERHEFDYAIDAVSRTFLALDVALTRVQSLPTPEERAAHKFKQPYLGGCLKPIHVRTIRRVYGKAGSEVLQAVHENPLVAIPVVTNTLRRKEDEWKRVQRSWNRVWRGVEAHNFFESWDHEGATARERDANATTSRTLIEELEQGRTARMQRIAALVDPAMRGAELQSGDWRTGVEYPDVLQDVLKLVFAFLDNLPRTSGVDARRVEGFLRFFVPLVFAGHQDAWDTAFSTTSEQESDAERAAAAAKKKAKDKKNGITLNGVSNGDASTNGLIISNGEVLAPEIPSPVVQPMEVDREEDLVDQTATQAATKKTLVLFADNKLYVLLRLIEFLYARLAHFSHISHTLSTVESGSSYLEHPLAVQLGLGRSLPALAQAYGGVPERFYDVLLESIETLFAGEMGEAMFHANLRMLFGFEAVKLFSIDRIIGTIVKQVQAVLGDKRSRHLVGLLHRQRAEPDGFLLEWSAYRRAAEEEAGDESLVFVRVESTAMIAQLLLPGDRLPPDTERVRERWQAYLDSYTRKGRTRGVAKPKSPFLYRNLPRTKDAWSRDKSRVRSKRELEAKIDPHSYRLFYVSGTEELVVRRWKKEERAAAESRAVARIEEGRRGLENLKFVNREVA